ncbi:MAG: ATP-binding protein [Natrialbaceae archaeon]|nr:ATP-binding protein [Natrialbaceae archaeon]
MSRPAGATLTVEESMSLEADPNRLRELLENLFRNAVEHGGTDVEVKVDTLEWAQTERAEGTVSGFVVEDTGPGISDELDDIFAFGETTRDDGTGFGLGIVKQIAEAHGWSVTANEGDDGGARFEFSDVSELAQ